MSQRRIVVTGLGAVTPYGIGAETLIERWCKGESGITDGLGTCVDFAARDHLTQADIALYDRFTHFAAVVGDEAVEMAGWKRDGLPVPPERIGCIIGTGSGGQGTLVNGTRDFLDGGGNIERLLIPKSMNSAAASALAVRYDLQGPAHSVASACSSGSDAIAEAMRMLRLGKADAMIVGGADAGLHELPIAAFYHMEALSSDGVARPFDARRDGFVMGEGGGVMVLEAADVAERRGARIIGDVLGYGVTNDAHNIVAPHPEGRGAVKAMQNALANAGIGSDAVDYINAHGTATPANDRTETIAIKKVFGERAMSVPVSSLKSAIGHLIGGAGAVETIATLLALRDEVAPPTLNWEVQEEGMDLDYVPRDSRPLFGNGTAPASADRRVALSNSFGFGGHNSVLVLAVPATAA